MNPERKTVQWTKKNEALASKWFLLLTIFISSQLFAQDEDAYIRRFPEKITARIGYQNTSNSFTVRDGETGKDFVLEPSKKDYLGISLLFRSIEVNVGFSPKFVSADENLQDAKLFTLNFRMFLGRWMQTLDFYHQKGFVFGDTTGSVYFPDLSTTKVGGTTNYIFNKNFSFRAIGFQNEWQKKSAGSFIPRMTFYYTNYFWEFEDLYVNDDSYDLAIGPGYYYNLVIAKNFIISGGVATGVGVNITRSGDETLTSLLLETNFRGVAGYNSERFFAGINSNLLVLSHNEERSTSIQDNISFVELYVGYRFDAPKKFMKWADYVNEKLGF